MHSQGITECKTLAGEHNVWQQYSKKMSPLTMMVCYYSHY